MTDERTLSIRRQVEDLWAETFGEQPAISSDPQTMIRILVECLEDVGPWELAKALPSV